MQLEMEILKENFVAIIDAKNSLYLTEFKKYIKYKLISLMMQILIS